MLTTLSETYDDGVDDNVSNNNNTHRQIRKTEEKNGNVKIFSQNQIFFKLCWLVSAINNLHRVTCTRMTACLTHCSYYKDSAYLSDHYAIKTCFQGHCFNQKLYFCRTMALACNIAYRHVQTQLIRIAQNISGRWEQESMLQLKSKFSDNNNRTSSTNNSSRSLLQLPLLQSATVPGTLSLLSVGVARNVEISTQSIFTFTRYLGAGVCLDWTEEAAKSMQWNARW